MSQSRQEEHARAVETSALASNEIASAAEAIALTNGEFALAPYRFPARGETQPRARRPRRLSRRATTAASAHSWSRATARCATTTRRARAHTHARACARVSARPPECPLSLLTTPSWSLLHFGRLGTFWGISLLYFAHSLFLHHTKLPR
eukprot:6196784-Pleurochrysis_carterae.AAC.1